MGFATRGVIEGFYGVYYTAPERDDLLRFLGAQGFNAYIYAPKNDRQHRARWREPYPPRSLEQFAATIRLAQQVGVAFHYAISPGHSICFSSSEDFDCLIGKLREFFRLGVRNFSLGLDDIDPLFSFPEDRQVYANYAEAQADLSNRLYGELQGWDSSCTLSLCPTDYYGEPPFSPYLQALGQALHPAIDVFYTGPRVCSPQITAADGRAFGDALGRAPLIWDNYPVNDLGMQAELHIGPLRGRDPELAQVSRGLVANLMPQEEASKIPLATLATFFRDPQGYDPEAAWEAALESAAGEESLPHLRAFAENSLHSCLGIPESERLDRLAAEAVAALRAGESPRSVACSRLDAYLESLDEACYHLRNRMENLALRGNLLPWIELLDHWQDMGRRALRVLERLESGQNFDKDEYFMEEMRRSALRHTKQIGGASLLPLADLARERIEKVEPVLEKSEDL